MDGFLRSAGCNDISAWDEENNGLVNFIRSSAGSNFSDATGHIIRVMYTGPVGPNLITYAQMQDASCGWFCNPQGTLDSVNINAAGTSMDTGSSIISSALVREAPAGAALLQNSDWHGFTL
jgi:hypothetical protein